MPALYNSNKDIPDDMLLGNLLFYNIGNIHISENDLINIFNKNNLSELYIRKISHSDAFRRATSSIKNYKVTYVDDNKDCFEGRINVDEVVNDQMYIKRIVGVRILNDQKEEVSYVQLGSLTYDRANDRCSVYTEPDAFTHVNSINTVMQQAKSNYTAWSVYHNHDTIKNIVNRIVNSMHPIALMPTGICKFIPKDSKAILYALKNVLNDLSQYVNKSGENVVELIPILDTQEHRNVINDAYESDIQESLQEYSSELTDILKNKKVLSVRQATTYASRYKELMAKTKTYQRLLGTYTNNITMQLQTALKFIDENKEDDNE